MEWDKGQFCCHRGQLQEGSLGPQWTWPPQRVTQVLTRSHLFSTRGFFSLAWFGMCAPGSWAWRFAVSEEHWVFYFWKRILWMGSGFFSLPHVWFTLVSPGTALCLYTWFLGWLLFLSLPSFSVSLAFLWLLIFVKCTPPSAQAGLIGFIILNSEFALVLVNELTHSSFRKSPQKIVFGSSVDPTWLFWVNPVLHQLHLLITKVVFLWLGLQPMLKAFFRELLR